MWLSVIILCYSLIAIAIVISLLLHGVRPAKTLAWLLAIFTIPVGGILLYLMLGRNRRKQKLYVQNPQLPKSSSTPQHELLNGLPERFTKIVRMIDDHTGYPLSSDNELSFLKDGEATFSHILKALNEANQYIHIQYYIFEEGELAERLKALFLKKVASGVKIRLIYDNIGSYSLSKSYIRSLKKAGVEVYPFLPFKFGKFFSGINYRNHRKIIVVDGEVAFTGGINISDKYLRGDSLGLWHDMHLELKGSAAHQLDSVFLNDWELVSGQRIPLEAPRRASHVYNRVQLLPSGPDDDLPLMEHLYFSMIQAAQKTIYITNPYIIPSPPVQMALQNAALSGIDVRLLLSEETDSRLVNWCVQSYFQGFLRAGIKIYRYPEGFLHSKIIIVDAELATVGTANVDNRSFQQNYEVNAVLYEKQHATLLHQDFLSEVEKSEELVYEQFVNRPWSHRLLEGLARVASPLL